MDPEFNFELSAEELAECRAEVSTASDEELNEFLGKLRYMGVQVGVTAGTEATFRIIRDQLDLVEANPMPEGTPELLTSLARAILAPFSRALKVIEKVHYEDIKKMTEKNVWVEKEESTDG